MTNLEELIEKEREEYNKLIGEKFGNYIIKEFINRGEWGIVFRAEDEYKYEVALKILKPTKFAMKLFKARKFENFYEAFRNEQISLIDLQDSENILLRTLDYIKINGDKIGYLIMPLYGKKENNNYKDATLDWILNNKYYKKGIEIWDVDKLFANIIRGISQVHKIEKCHSDIKPDNFIVKYEKGKSSEIKNIERILVADLGTSSMYAYKFANKNLRSNMGFPYTRSPENFKGEHPSYESDIWGMGSLLFKILTGKYVLEDEINSEKQGWLNNLSSKDGDELIEQKFETFKHQIPKHFRDILKKCLKFNSEERFHDANELKKEFTIINQERRKREKLLKSVEYYYIIYLSENGFGVEHHNLPDKHTRLINKHSEETIYDINLNEKEEINKLYENKINEYKNEINNLKLLGVDLLDEEIIKVITTDLNQFKEIKENYYKLYEKISFIRKLVNSNKDISNNALENILRNYKNKLNKYNKEHFYFSLETHLISEYISSIKNEGEEKYNKFYYRLWRKNKQVELSESNISISEEYIESLSDNEFKIKLFQMLDEPFRYCREEDYDKVFPDKKKSLLKSRNNNLENNETTLTEKNNILLKSEWDL
jgi:serine/threonine protein kinase